MLPVVTLSAKLGGADLAGVRSIGGGSASQSGAAAAGTLGWFAVLAFAGSAASRFVREMAPFKRRIDAVAFIILVAAIVWAFTDGPVADQVRTSRQVSGMFQGMDGRAGASAGVPAIAISVLPGLGSLFVVLAPLALVLARRRETEARSPAI